MSLTAADPRVVRLPMNLLYVAKSKQANFNKNDPTLKAFVANLKDVEDLIHPIVVRAVDKRYEVMIGRKRFWGAQQLGWKTILCRIEVWEDDDADYLALAENMYRSHYSGAQCAITYKKIMKSLEKRLGHPDPSKKAQGSGPGRGKKTTPLRARAFSRIIVEETGISQQSLSEYSKLANAFTDEQLSNFDVLGLTAVDLKKIVKVHDQDERTRVINLVLAGQSVADALAEVVLTPDTTQDVKAAGAEESLSDEEWLTSVCGAFMAQLGNSDHFRRDALLYRHTQAQRSALLVRIISENVPDNHMRRPLVRRILRATAFAPPHEWFVCPFCKGVGCSACDQFGYTIKDLSWEDISISM